MNLRLRPALAAIILFALFSGSQTPGAAQGGPTSVAILSREGILLNRLTDGDTVRLQGVLAQEAEAERQIAFQLGPDGLPLGTCTVARGKDRCETEPLQAFGWYWGPDGQPVVRRTLQAAADGGLPEAAVEVEVVPRPVVMVHGFSSDYRAWSAYLGPQGHLASIGVPGFAVGDGQFPGELNTGRLDDPGGGTNTIAQNAVILKDYIAAVKEATGAERVDLLAHSMGGLISRYYIGRVMEERDVSQLLMLGSPMGGTECANLPASLGLYLPAVLEIRPSYVRQIFNSQVEDRRGVPFFALAGVPIQEAFQSPCTGIPTDLAVSRESVAAIPLELVEMPVLHTDLNVSREVFDAFVRPRLQAPVGATIEVEVGSVAVSEAGPGLQFTRVFNGRVEAGGSSQVTIQVDEGVSVASFALYDPTRSLAVSVRGASGNEIPLDAEQNGLVVVNDPTALFFLGYGFKNPKPGAWQVTLLATEKTPAGGSDYALTAYFVGGARLETRASSLLPRVGEAVELNVRLETAGQPLPIETAQALIRSADGTVTAVDLTPSSGEHRGTWQPPAPGLYGIDLIVRGRSPGGAAVERSAFLTVQAQPAPTSPLRAAATLLALVCPVFLGVGVALGFLFRRRRKLKNELIESPPGGP